jgi:hypothetical protein
MPLTIAVAVVAMLLPSLAQADFQTLFNDYRADGTIDGCNYSQSDLSAGLSSVPSDVRQYDPAFSDAINAAMEQAAAGCNASPSEASSIKNEISAADGSPGPAPPKGLALASPGDAREIPAVLIAVMVLLGAALGAAAALLAARRYSAASSTSQPKSSGF